MMRLVTMVTVLGDTETTYEVIDGDVGGDDNDGRDVWSFTVPHGGADTYCDAERQQRTIAERVRHASTDGDVERIRYDVHPELYECEVCSKMPVADGIAWQHAFAVFSEEPLCDRCFEARKAAGSGWRGPRDKHYIYGVALAWERRPLDLQRLR